MKLNKAALYHFIERNAKRILNPTTAPKYGWFGDYNTWEEAEKDTSGYDSHLILEKVKTALLKVRNGEAIFERDSVIFDEIQ